MPAVLASSLALPSGMMLTFRTVAAPPPEGALIELGRFRPGWLEAVNSFWIRQIACSWSPAAPWNSGPLVSLNSGSVVEQA